MSRCDEAVAAEIDFDDFLKVDMRAGTIRDARENSRARVPAYVLSIDFGPLGTRTSSAQLTENYVVDEYRRGGVTAQAKERFDKAMAAVRRRQEGRQKNA